MKRLSKTFIYALFGIYSVIMIWLLFGQRIGMGGEGTYLERFAGNINLIPFHTIRRFIRTIIITSDPHLLRHAIVNLAGNVIMFVPLGVFIPCLYTRYRSFLRTVLCSAVCICLIELFQLVTLLGKCDIDDIILNTVGCGIGFAFIIKHL